MYTHIQLQTFHIKHFSTSAKCWTQSGYRTDCCIADWVCVPVFVINIYVESFSYTFLAFSI